MSLELEPTVPENPAYPLALSPAPVSVSRDQGEQIVSIANRAVRVVDALNEVPAVITISDNNLASLAIKESKSVKKDAEELRTRIKAPYLEYGRAIDTVFSELLKGMNEAADKAAKGMMEFKEKQDAIADARAAEERAKLAAAMPKTEEQGQDYTPPVIPEVVAKKSKTSEMNVAGVSSRRTKKWRVKDISLVPVMYLTTNDAVLTAKRREYDFDAPSDIPGIEFYYEESI